MSKISARAVQFLKEKGHKFTDAEIEAVFFQINNPQANNKSIVYYLKDKLNLSPALLYEMLSSISLEPNWNVAKSKNIEFRELFNCGPYWKDLESRLTQSFRDLSLTRHNAFEENLGLGFKPLSVENTFIWIMSTFIHKGPAALKETNHANSKGLSFDVKDIAKVATTIDLSVLKRIMIGSVININRSESLSSVRKSIVAYIESNDKSLFAQDIKDIVETLEKENNLENLWKKLPGYLSPTFPDNIASKDNLQHQSLEDAYEKRISSEVYSLLENNETFEIGSSFIKKCSTLQESDSFLQSIEIFTKTVETGSSFMKNTSTQQEKDSFRQAHELLEVYLLVESSMRKNPVVFKGDQYFDAKNILENFKLLMKKGGFKQIPE